MTERSKDHPVDAAPLSLVEAGQAGSRPDPGNSTITFVQNQRGSLASALAIIRNPLTAFPPATFRSDLVGTKMFGRKRLFVCNPALIQDLLVRNGEILVKGEENRRVLEPALGNGLLTAQGSTWKWQRQALSPAFQIDMIRALLPAFVSAAEETRDRWLAAGDGSTIALGQELTRTTFKIILETMLSGAEQIDAARFETAIRDYLTATNWMSLYAILRAPTWLPYPGKRRALRAAAYMRQAVRTMVARRRAEAEQKPDLVALMLAASDPEDGRRMSDEDITDNLLTFISAGHETTALALTWTLALLSDEPEVEAKILDEIATVTEGGSVRPEHVERFVYLKQVFNEGMRLFPPAAMILRAAAADFECGGRSVKAGTVIIVPIYAVHRHKKLWSDPEKFDPDRFAANETRNRHRYAFMPFGAGHRVCIGSAFATLEAVAILAVLLKALRLERTEPNLPTPALRVTLRPSREIPMNARARIDARADAVSAACGTD